MAALKPEVLVVMGVSGCGKSAVGQALAEVLKWKFYDADDFHPLQNIEKMQRTEPLNDSDREPWLKRLSSLIDSEHDQGLVLACSALKQRYRDTLSTNTHVTFIHLEGSYELIATRMKARQHFMPPTLLRSQFAALEPPADAIAVSIDQDIPDIVDEILRQLQS